MKYKETNHWEIILHPNQYYLGYSVIVLKRKCRHLSGLKKEEVLDFFKIVKKFEATLKKVFGATMFNWTCLMNDSHKEDKPPAQVHWHVRPRYKNEIKFAGQTFHDKVFAHHYDKTKKKKVSKKILEQIAEKIK